MSTEAVAVATEAPLNVRVGKALGVSPRVEFWIMDREEQGVYISFLSRGEAERHMKECGPERYPGGLYEEEGAHIVEREIYPRYDTDWNAAAPLIEKYVVMLNSYVRHGNGWLAGALVCDTSPEADDGGAYFGENAETPLQAVCSLILSLHADGKLALAGRSAAEPCP